jgi:pilus assembly protein CpaE
VSGLLVASPSEKFDVKLDEIFDNTLGGHRRYWRDGLLEANSVSIVAELTRTNPAVVAIGPGLDDAVALDLVEAFDTHRPDVTVIIVAEPSLQLLERALRSGARDVVDPDAPSSELRDAFDQALDAAGRRRTALTSTSDTETPNRHVMCVLAPKGGTGKTTVSTNLASGLALEAPGEVVIVDLDFQFGDVASALRMTPEHTFADIAQSTSAVDVTTIKVFLTPSDTGLFALCAPESPVEADPITPQMVQHVISLLSSEFRYVVIDTGSGLDEGTLSVLKLCTDLVLVTSTDSTCSGSPTRPVTSS